MPGMPLRPLSPEPTVHMPPLRRIQVLKVRSWRRKGLRGGTILIAGLTEAGSPENRENSKMEAWVVDVGRHHGRMIY